MGELHDIFDNTIMDFYTTLNNGAKMPRLGLGTWKAPAEKTKEAILTAVKAGYRMIDCANDYDNEHVIGEALQELFAAGVVKREDLFIQAKLWNSNHRPEHVKPDLMKTLEDLQLDYIDSFVIHWPQAVPSTGKICTLCCKSVTPSRIIENFKVWDFSLDTGDMAAIDKMNVGWRHLLWAETSMHPDHPFKDCLPWDD